MTPASLRFMLAAGGLAVLGAAPTLAQTSGAAPDYGVIGYAPSAGPVSASARAGGAISASRIDAACAGFISDTPTLALDVNGGTDALYISAASDADTTLVVRDPGGGWLCDDDGGEGRFNPGLRIENAASGRYEIWIGTLQAGVGYPVAMAHISGQGFSAENPYARTLEPGDEPQARLSVSAGFAEDPRRMRVTAGGDLDLGGTDTGCFGYVSAAPSAALIYEADALELFLAAARDEADLVMAVQTPAGAWLCDDDSAGALNPGVHITAPQSGPYLIWVGTFGQSAPVEAEITVSEIGFAGLDTRLDPAAPARFGAHRLAGLFEPDPQTWRVEAGGGIEASRGVDGAALVNGWCAGYITREPTLELDFDGEGAAGPLFVSVTAEEDATLAINAPDGGWWCDDDGGSGVNPAIVFETPQAGIYDIYVGAFSRAARGFEAALHASRTGPGPAGVASSIDPALPALFGEVSLRAGFTPAPYNVVLEAGGPNAAYEAGVEAEDGGCAGSLTTAPSVRLDWDGEAGPLVFSVESEGDATLAVLQPSGEWACDDDGGEGLNPRLVLNPAEDGAYAVYVGAFGAGGEPAALTISETPPFDGDEAPGEID